MKALDEPNVFSPLAGACKADWEQLDILVNRPNLPQMTFLPAAVWKQIALEQPLETAAAKVAFKLNPSQLVKMEDLWMQEEGRAQTPPRDCGSLRRPEPHVVANDC